MPQSSRPGKRLLRALQRLVWIAAQPQHLRQIGQAVHPRVLRDVRYIGAMPLLIVERQALQILLLGEGKLPSLIEDLPQKHRGP